MHLPQIRGLPRRIFEPQWVGKEVGSYPCEFTGPASASGVHVGGVRFGNVRVDLRAGSLPFPASWYVMALRRHMAIIVIADKNKCRDSD